MNTVGTIIGWIVVFTIMAGAIALCIAIPLNGARVWWRRETDRHKAATRAAADMRHLNDVRFWMDRRACGGPCERHAADDMITYLTSTTIDERRAAWRTGHKPSAASAGRGPGRGPTG